MIISLEDFPLLEDKVNRLIDTHAKKGFAIVSACRGDKTPKENLERTESLKKDLKEMGWSYTIVYGGGFKEKGEEVDTSKHNFNEISYLIYNYNRKGERNLLKDAIALCRKYNQDDIYYQEPEGKAYWYDKEGNKDATFSCMSKNDDGQMYFTGFGSKLSKKVKQTYESKGEPKNAKAFEHRFSGIMEGIEPPPCSLVEEMKRKNDGEVFISSRNVLSNAEVLDLLKEEKKFKYFDY